MIGIINKDLLLTDNIYLVKSCAIPSNIPANNANTEFMKGCISKSTDNSLQNC